MSKATEKKSSIGSCVFGIKHILRDLQTKVPALSKSNQISVTNNELHAFGPVNIDKIRIEFKQQIDIIRSICSQFETEVLGDVMKLGAGADPAFRKHFNQLKEQATTESTVLRLQEHLQQSNDYLEKALSDKEAVTSNVQVKQLEKLAKSMGLVSFVDSSQKDAGVPSTTITLGGTVIVVDIDIDGKGKVQRTKVTFVPEHLQNDHDEKLDELLARNLQTQDFEGFKRNLGTLALLDRLNVEYAPTDFFTIVRNLFKDLETNCGHETLLSSNNILEVLSEGHGIPTLYLDYPGISIAYWIDKSDASLIDWEDVRETVEKGISHSALNETRKLFISFEESATLQSFLPPHRSNYMLAFDEMEDLIDSEGDQLKIIREAKWPKFMQPLRFVKPVPGLNDIPVRFVAKLDSPIPASDMIVRKLMKVTGLLKDASDISTKHTVHNQRSLSLEELLVVELSLDTVKTNRLATNSIWVKKIDDASDQVYQWLGKTASTPGKLLHRVPFQHPAQLYSIMMYLRQQQMFNSLFTSIFNEDTYQEGVNISTKAKKTLSLGEMMLESQNDDKLRIEVTTFDAPRTIQLSLSPPLSSQYPFISIPVIIDIPTSNAYQPTVRVDAVTANLETDREEMVWNPYVVDQEEMNNVLRSHCKIPPFIQWLWKTIEQHKGDYFYERSPLKRSHASMMELE